MVNLRALVAVLILASCACAGCAEESSSKLRNPVQCYLVEFGQGGDQQLTTAMKDLAAKRGLVLDTSSPSYVLLNWPAGAHSVLLLRGTGTSGLLATYESKDGPAISIDSLVALRGLSFAQCPPTSVDFSPPTFYE